MYYAVSKGRNPGVYRTWDECKAQVDKYSGAVYKKFPTLSEANSFIERGSYSSLPPHITRKTTRELYSSTKPQPSFVPEKKAFKSYSSNTITTPLCEILKQYGCDGRVEIYTDGACSSNGCSGAKAGIGVFFGDNHSLNISEPVHGRATNNNAEIQAVTRAAEIAYQSGLTKIRINTDSEFLINCITKWMPAWKKRQWKTAKGQPVINKVELQEMEQALSRLDVVFNHVRGHVGIYGNEMADKLAREGAEMYSSINV